jgi:hypothetical protein
VETIVLPTFQLLNVQTHGENVLQSWFAAVIPGQSCAFLPGTGMANVPVIFSQPEVAFTPEVVADQFAES